MTSVLAGFYGKLPARGDFVRSVLPRDFTDPWDQWLAGVMAGSRAQMGEDWLPAFLESPVWRFTLPAGACGTRAALGLMLPSVDRAGRYFPLTFAALFDDRAVVTDGAALDAWLDRCEAAGRAALEEDAAPERLSDMLGLPDGPPTGNGETGVRGTMWWTDGAPRVPATRLEIRGLPDAATYATMLGAHAAREAPMTSGDDAWDQPS